MQPANGKIYFAGPLFTTAEIIFNKELAKYLKEYSFKVLLPQDFAINKDMSKKRSAKDIAEYDIKMLDSCDIVVANCDGADADSGTAVELGYAVAKNKIVIAYRTDCRNFAQGEACNAMLYIANQMILEIHDKTNIKLLAFKIKRAIFEEKEKRSKVKVK